MRRCLDCGVDVSARPYARYCDTCRPWHRLKHRKYVFDAGKDAYLREHYSFERGVADRIAALWGYPLWAIRLRAAQLGIARPGWRGGFKPWTAKELKLIERYAGRRTPIWIARKLRRSVSAVVGKMRRLRLSRLPDGYTQDQVAEGFGVSRDTVERWQRRGWLRSAFTPRPGQPFRLTEREILDFITNHRNAFDLRKVDQTWFLDLVLFSTAQANGVAA